MNPYQDQDPNHPFRQPVDGSPDQNSSSGMQIPCSYYNPQTDQFEQVEIKQAPHAKHSSKYSGKSSRDQDYYHVYLQYHQTPNPFSSELKFVPGVGFVKMSPYDKERQRLKKAGALIGLCFLIFLILSYLVGGLIIYLFQLLYSGLFISQDGLQQILNNPLLNQIFLCLNYALPILLAFSLLKHWIKIPFSAAFPSNKLSGRIVFLAVGVSLGAIVVASYASSLLSSALSLIGVQPVMSYFSPPTAPAALIIYYFTFAVLAAVLEEFAFRGVILQSLRRHGDSFALFASSILFALLHGNLVQAPSAFIFGLVLGFFVLKTGSVWIGVIVHFINNFCSLTLRVLSQNSSAKVTETISISINILFLLIGFVCLFTLIKNSAGLWELKSQGSKLQPKDKAVVFFGSPIMLGTIIVFAFHMIQMLRVIKR